MCMYMFTNIVFCILCLFLFTNSLKGNCWRLNKMNLLVHLDIILYPGHLYRINKWKGFPSQVVGKTTLESSSVSTPTSSYKMGNFLLNILPDLYSIFWYMNLLNNFRLTRNCFLLLGYPSRMASIMSDAYTKKV